MESDLDMAKCLMLLAESGGPTKRHRTYECSTCGKRFVSFQALGGHRASHSHSHDHEDKKRRRSAGSRDVMSAKSCTRSYKCWMCESVFSSGQALGGHMRKHRPLASGCAETVSFDLNFPPLEEGQDNGESY